MAAIMLNAAAMAYRKASAKTRDATKSNPDIPPWLAHFADQLREDDSEAAPSSLKEPAYHKKERLLSKSDLAYERFAWKVYKNITSTSQFEAFILVNILLVGVTTGLDLENQGRDPWTVVLSDWIAIITLVVFTVECMVKIIAEAYEPWNYFSDPEDGTFNCFDFFIVVASYGFMGSSAGGAIAALRMLRLVRLLTFVKNVPELRIIVAGLIQGVKSVVYIVVLLFLIIYIFAILACILFGENDPARFGDVSISIVTLFQVSTQASWTGIAYVSWYGCEDYLSSPYGDEYKSRIHTIAGDFEGFKCTVNHPKPFLTAIFFALYILLTAWVIMSLFIGVISMGMFESYIVMKEEKDLQSYIDRLAENTMREKPAEEHAMATGRLSLKTKIDMILDDSHYQHSVEESGESLYEIYVHKMKKVRDSDAFTMLITFVIIIVGLVIGIDTDLTLKCNRIEWRDMKRDDNGLDSKMDDCEHPPLFLAVIDIVSQTIFTFEAVVKISAEGTRPLRYFTDSENGGWNCLDFFIVIVGFLEYTPADFIFKNFPVVLLRLLRLLRVFRLAKALPRLRSIVEALVSGFSSVGWICILIIVFNYIVACMFMLLFRDNDPFHFGSVGRAMFTVLRIETLDTWDQILYMAMYGCKSYPAGYPFLADNPGTDCNDSESFGWLGVVIFFFTLILGAYVMPTILIGIVSIKFDKATKLLAILTEQKDQFSRRLKDAQEAMPHFFTEQRVEAIQDVFATLDSSGELSLDMQEISPFFHYVLDSVFEVECSPKIFESLFYLVDSNHGSEIGMGEFLTVIKVIKQFEQRIKGDAEYRHELFGKDSKSSQKDAPAGKTTWDRAMDRVDADSLDAAWEAIIRSINGVPGDTTAEKVDNLFKEFDSDGSKELDLTELGAGLKECGIRLNDRQINVLATSVDIDGDGSISFGEFAIQVEKVKQKKIQDQEVKDREIMNSAIKRSSSKETGFSDLVQQDPVVLQLKDDIHKIGLNIAGLKAEISYLEKMEEVNSRKSNPKKYENQRSSLQQLDVLGIEDLMGQFSFNLGTTL